MHTSLFDYELPPDRIAQHSVEPRDHAKLLCVDRATGALEDHHVYDLPSLLRAGDLVIFNDSKVFKARFFAKQKQGRKIELLFHRALERNVWEALAKPAKHLQEGETLTLDGGWQARVLRKDPLKGTVQLELPHDQETFFAYSDAHGDVPTPPYVEADAATKAGYQTVYAKTPGSVAAPTAGFHFTERLLEEIDAKGIQRAFVTLHVGIGTFRPMKSDSLEEHVMHEEWGHVPRETIERIRETKAAGHRVIAVGTTATRALESWAYHLASNPSHSLGEEGFWTSLFITPGYTFHVIDGLLTNFHLPKSTLLVLVSAFLGREKALAAYRHAIDHGYRFYSFGDAMLIC